MTTSPSSVGPYSVIVLRDDDEEVRAFHNVCRHRGARLLAEEPRARSATSCAATTAGPTRPTAACMHAADQPPSSTRAASALRPVHVRDVAGLLFVCLAAEPARRLRRGRRHASTPYLAPHQLRRTKVAAQIDLVEDGNWKLVMENNRECYHCEAATRSCSAPSSRPAATPPTRSRRGCAPRTSATCAPTPSWTWPASSAACPTRAVEELDDRRVGVPRRSARRWTVPASPTPSTARLRADGCSATSTARGSGRLAPAHAAQLVVPLPRRPRRDVRGAPAGRRPDAGAHDLAGARGRRRGRRLRRRRRSPTCGARPTSRTAPSSPAPSRRRRPGLRARSLLRRPSTRWTRSSPGTSTACARRSPDDRHRFPGPTRTAAPALRLVPDLPPPLGDGLLPPEAPLDQEIVLRRRRAGHPRRGDGRAGADAARRRAFAPGQYLTIAVDVDGHLVERCYTIASPPTRPHLLTVTVKRVPDGAVSTYLHDRLRPGDRLTGARAAR